jgi:hypothetical protein
MACTSGGRMPAAGYRDGRGRWQPGDDRVLRVWLQRDGR